MPKINIESINSFYDAVAADYNSHMTDNDKRAREKVRQLFRQYVSSGCVLDFGGGTGLDLNWLLNDNYTVFFLEPSVNMRSIASKDVAKSRSINFIEKNLDLAKWSSTDLPFQDKMDGVIANFAVLNCIEDIAMFFEKIALVCKKGCYVFVIIIDSKPQFLLKNYSLLSALRIFFMRYIKIRHRYKNIYHNTFIHSIRTIKKVTSKNFNFVKILPIEFSDFAVLIFSKK